MDPNLALTIVGTVIAAIGGIVGYKWVTTRGMDQKVLGKKIKIYEDVLNEYENELKHWKGKYNQSKQIEKVDGDYDLDNQSDVASLAKLVLPNILDLLPQDLKIKAQGFLDNPELVDMAVKLYEKHPDEVKGLLAKFIKKRGTADGGQAGELAPGQSINASDYGA